MSERRLTDDDSVGAPTRSRWRRRLIALAIYLACLAASSVVQGATAGTAPRSVGLADPADAGRRRHTAAGDPEVVPVTIAFDRRCPPESATRGPAVVLLHGSPGGRFDFHGVTDALARDRCVIAPDLPGFGDSTRDVPDYSVAAHAAYVDALLTALHEPRVHVVGFSMGGGVAIDLPSGRPVAIASLTLLSGLGVQEQELFGRYWVNHAVHGVQLAALWLLIEATPHFGAFDRMFMGVEYARNFYDTDQRPLRPALLAYDGPALIYHGRHDFLVPYEAALEHHRLLPQSVLVTSEGDHFDTFMRPGEVASALVPSWPPSIVASGRRARPRRKRGASRPGGPTTARSAPHTWGRASL